MPLLDSIQSTARATAASSATQSEESEESSVAHVQENIKIFKDKRLSTESTARKDHRQLKKFKNNVHVGLCSLVPLVVLCSLSPRLHRVFSRESRHCRLSQPTCTSCSLLAGLLRRPNTFSCPQYIGQYRLPEVQYKVHSSLFGVWSGDRKSLKKSKEVVGSRPKPTWRGGGGLRIAVQIRASI